MKLIGTSLTLFALAALASPHFIWAEQLPSGPRQVVFSLAEAPGDDTLPVMKNVGPKIKVLSGTLIKPVNADLSHIFTSNSLGGPTLAYIPYGVVDRGGSVYFLDYFAKAVTHPTDAAKAAGKGFELVATLETDAWVVSALVDGKPATDAEIVTGSDKAEVKYPRGQQVRIPLSDTPARIPIRANRTVDRTGELDGKKYTTARQWTTLVLPAASKATTGSEPDAYRALEIATESRESLRQGTVGWTSRFSATNGSSNIAGTVKWGGTGSVNIAFEMPENSYTKHVTGQLSSLFAHRLDRPFWTGEGRHAIAWGTDVNELGRKIFVKDNMNSSYRLKDGRIRQVVRTFGEEELTLNITKMKDLPGGRYITTEFTSQSKNLKTGEVVTELVYKDEFKQFGSEWLPVQRTVSGKTHGSPILMKVKFANYLLAEVPSKQPTDPQIRQNSN